MAIEIDKKTFWLMFASAVIGFLVNYISTVIANRKLKSDLLAEWAALNNQQHQGRVSPAENLKIEQRKNEIQAQLKVLSK